jgi:hypothetical protein
MKKDEYVHFTEKEIKMLERAYEKAMKAGEETFSFGTREWLTSYAGYALEYLKGKLETNIERKKNHE